VGMLSLADMVEQDAAGAELLVGTLKRICAPSRPMAAKRARVA